MSQYCLPFDLPSTSLLKLMEADLRLQLESTLGDRVRRFTGVRGIAILPATVFNRLSHECLYLYRDGYFFACVSLCQAVAEALSRSLAERSTPRIRGKHPARIAHLHAASRLSTAAVTRFTRIHQRRNDFHHINPGVPSGLAELQSEAKTVYEALVITLEEVYSYTANAGALVPDHPEYWGTGAT